MILAEIADKLPAPSVFPIAAGLIGLMIGLALRLTRGGVRAVAMTAAVIVGGTNWWILRIDADLRAGAQNELGSQYIVLSTWWPVGAAIFGFVVFLLSDFFFPIQRGGLRGNSQRNA